MSMSSSARRALLAAAIVAPLVLPTSGQAAVLCIDPPVFPSTPGTTPTTPGTTPTTPGTTPTGTTPWPTTPGTTPTGTTPTGTTPWPTTPGTTPTTPGTTPTGTTPTGTTPWPTTPGTTPTTPGTTPTTPGTTPTGTTPAPVIPLPRPNGPGVHDIGPTQATLTWSLPFGCWDVPVTWAIEVNGTEIGRVVSNGTVSAYTLTGLSPNTRYDVTVRAVGAGGVTGPPNSIWFTTRSGGTVPESPYALDLNGSALLRTRTPATLPLAGRLQFSPNLVSGLFAGALQLSPSTLSLWAGGAIPVRANAAFAAVGAAAGGLTYSGFSVNSQQSITFTKARVLGIDLLGGRACRSTSPALLQLTAPSFSLSGSPFRASGSLSLYGFTGCGALGQFLAPTGKANPVSVVLKGAAPTPIPQLAS